ncbi:sulfotransferase 2A6-like [Ptychodera flava]|uniref:sulfotransferase 2A6-like n=1 Tax=Ptychodera flava TaxID=63121 RepID=UPI00396A4C71
MRFGSWLENVVGWNRYGLKDNVLHVRFEDMKKDLGSVLAEVADFLGRPKTNEELDNVTESCIFTSMRNGPEFYQKYSAIGDVDSFTIGKRHLRKGQVGDWKNHFTAAQNELFDTEITQKTINMD